MQRGERERADYGNGLARTDRCIVPEANIFEMVSALSMGCPRTKSTTRREDIFLLESMRHTKKHENQLTLAQSGKGVRPCVRTRGRSGFQGDFEL